MSPMDGQALPAPKGPGNENFPVASLVLSKGHREAALAFYGFVRTADDIADTPGLSAAEKLIRLDVLEHALVAGDPKVPQAARLHQVDRTHGTGIAQARDMMRAFRQDAIKTRYSDWSDLTDYCRLSANPAGRFLLQLHSECASAQPPADALCTALQILNHLQDCGKDYRALDRVYVPLDALAAAGAKVEDLGATRASPALRECLRRLAVRTGLLLQQGEPLPGQISDFRLSLEIALIYALAGRINAMLTARDPLSEPVHLGKSGFIGMGLLAIARGLFRRLGRPAPAPAAQDV